MLTPKDRATAAALLRKILVALPARQGREVALARRLEGAIVALEVDADDRVPAARRDRS